MQLPGKVVLITGGSSGIGASTAHLLAKQGAHVLLVARGKDALDEQAETIRRAGGTVTTFPCDLSEVDQIVALGEAVRSSVGTPDIVVNNAGAGLFMYLDETEPSELAAMTALPYQAALLVTREFLPAMLARGSGWVVTVNSPVSRMPWPGATGYAGSRWALRGMTTALRMDLRGTGIGVSEVVPGKVRSEYFANNPGAEDRIPRIASLVPELSTEQVAVAIRDAIVKERREVLLPWQLKAFDLNARLLPALTEWLSWRTGFRR